MADAKSCRITLEQKGINDKHRQWLARLVTTRRIVIVPTANALGYYQNIREEDGIDPNRYDTSIHIRYNAAWEYGIHWIFFHFPETFRSMFKISSYACRL